MSPLDDSLHFIDDGLVLKMTKDRRVFIISGRPSHCPINSYDSDLATLTSLVEPQSLSFASNGDLYVAESDGKRINRVRVISTDGRISPFAGVSSTRCNCLDPGCDCFDADQHLAASAKFSSIASIACTPDGVLFIADQVSCNKKKNKFHKQLRQSRSRCDNSLFLYLCCFRTTFLFMPPPFLALAPLFSFWLGGINSREKRCCLLIRV